MEQRIAEYKNIELAAHVGIDDVLNKVTQEISELIEAYVNRDYQEMYNEASDVLVNVLSVVSETGLSLSEEKKKNNLTNIDPLNLSILHGKWNQKIQALRGRYSREEVKVEEVEEITSSLVQEVLNYSDPDLNMGQMIENNLEKFRSRIDNYKRDINVRDYITSYQDFPKPGIDFKDISPILKSPEAFRYVCMEMAGACSNSDVIVGLDSRGFLFGSMVAEYLGKPFVMVRKKGKLPGVTHVQDYGLEYGSDVIEIQEGTIQQGEKVAIIDDLLATGGTAKAAIDLVEKLGGDIDVVSFVISLDEQGLSNLESRRQLNGYNLHSVVSYGE